VQPFCTFEKVFEGKFPDCVRPGLVPSKGLRESKKAITAPAQ
jgi:hypothetical protein